MQAGFAGLHLFAGRLSLFALHFVGVGQSPASTERTPKAPLAGKAFGSAHPKPSPMKGRRRGGAATDAVGQSVFAPAMRFARLSISIFIYAIRVFISIRPY